MPWRQFKVDLKVVEASLQKGAQLIAILQPLIDSDAQSPSMSPFSLSLTREGMPD